MRRSFFSGLMLCVAVALTTGCGVEQEEPAASEVSAHVPEENLGEAEQNVCGPGAHAICEGWEAGGRRCLANCSGTNYWMDTGWAASGSGLSACWYISHGECGEKAQNFCFQRGWSYQGACWGRRG
ncbi:hypothetical protein [Pyxidicoccus xibeiensis]|uniref:hypothetical protein n=1 Tax=Pyxidicoccus xibeiensis TaxID=2906759 RepID=UPI0020A7B00C|nr:hypothetical protein [Pyxidicoccus xibeiensis]MCP3142788.1 hypothetical protein [Pyxidicoccus xibeiensis]